MTPKNGTILVGVVNFVGSLVSFLFVRNFKRKPLMVLGHFLVGSSLVSIGIFAYYDISMGVLIMMLIQLFVYQQTIGPLTWIYVTEVINDSGMGFVMLIYKAALLFVSTTNNFLMSSSLESYGVFWMFGGITLVGAVFHLLFMKETKDMTDKSKKAIFMPVEQTTCSEIELEEKHAEKKEEEVG